MGRQFLCRWIKFALRCLGAEHRVGDIAAVNVGEAEVAVNRFMARRKDAESTATQLITYLKIGLKAGFYFFRVTSRVMSTSTSFPTTPISANLPPPTW